MFIESIAVSNEPFLYVAVLSSDIIHVEESMSYDIYRKRFRVAVSNILTRVSSLPSLFNLKMETNQTILGVLARCSNVQLVSHN